MITLAHISDVHLAPLPPVRWSELVNKRITGYLNWRLRRHNTLSGDGLNTLVRHMREQKPDFTAVTGDLVNLGLEAEANTALQLAADCRRARRGLRLARQPRRLSCATSLGYNNARWGDYMSGETARRRASSPLSAASAMWRSFPAPAPCPAAPRFALGRFEQDAGRPAGAHPQDAGRRRLFPRRHDPSPAQPRGPSSAARPLRRQAASARPSPHSGAELVLHGHTHKSSIFAIPGLDRRRPGHRCCCRGRRPVRRTAARIPPATISSRSSVSAPPGAAPCANLAFSASAPILC